jgi:VanZ family protein
VIAWAGVIWTLSGGGFSGERTGAVILPLLSTLLPSATPGQLEVVHQGIRKLAHFTEYLILSLLLYRALDVEGRWSLRVAVLALVLAGLYAGSDELHQWFVPGRGARVSDCLIDVSGAAAGQALLAARAQRLRPRPA